MMAKHSFTNIILAYFGPLIVKLELVTQIYLIWETECHLWD